MKISSDQVVRSEDRLVTRTRSHTERETKNAARGRIRGMSQFAGSRW